MSDANTWVYITGGYYRRRDVPRGQPAEMIHGDNVLERWAAETAAQAERIRVLEEALRDALPVLVAAANGHVDPLSAMHPAMRAEHALKEQP